MHVRRAAIRGIRCLGAALLAAAVVAAHADSASITVTAVVLSKSNCKFSGGGAMTLAFGTINPSSASNATATATRNFSCNGSAPNATFLISAGDGLYASTPGVRRMRHGTTLTEYMTYGLALSPTSATVPKGSTQTLTVTGTLTPTDFGNVLSGSYSDTVAITLTP